jgi:hypothetical protein
MKMNVNELTGSKLDWAVSKCNNTIWNNPETKPYLFLKNHDNGFHYYSTNWAQGGPIIEREGIDLYCNVPTNPAHKDPSWRGSWRARYHRCGYGTDMSHGPTPLIAAMRCYVASKLGDVIDIPEELF